MSFLFGKKQPKLSTEESIAKLRETKELLEKKQAFLETQIENETASARKLAKTNKRKALQHLKRKKRQEADLNKLDNILANIDVLEDNLQNAQFSNEVTGAMSGAAKTLQSLNKANNLDKIDDIMDKITDQVEMGEEVSNALSRNLGTTEIDDDELEAELDELMIEELAGISDLDDLKLPEVPNDSLPVNTKTPAAASRTARADSDDLAELEAWAAQ